MAKVPDRIASLTLDSAGEVTKTKYIGTFRIKAVLTHGDRLQLERFYASLLPKNTETVSEEMKVRAATIAELSVRVIDGPGWWTDSNNGLLLLDAEPLYDLLMQCNSAYEDWLKRLNEQVGNEIDA